MSQYHRYVIPTDRIEPVGGFGLGTRRVGYVYRPSTVEGLLDVFDLARRSGRTVGLRGAGRSYGDAAMNSENLVLDLSRMKAILEWKPDTGLITVEPGATIQDVWTHVVPDGWWPPVVPGSMFPTVGGCAAMNVHGKNNFCSGPLGDHIERFEVITPAGGLLVCSREEHSELFHAVIGGFGMLGVLTSVTLRMKRIFSGFLDVVGVSIPTLHEMVREFESRRPHVDYLVGWIDAFADGVRRGRGVLHQATHVLEGVDPNPAQSLRVENQSLPTSLFGFLPKEFLWGAMRPLVNNFGMRMINATRYLSGRFFDGDGRCFRQSHAAFAFLLDYVPHWQRAYGPGGLIQYQSFVPASVAVDVFSEQIRLARRMGRTSYLSVLKRHRPDDFLISHGIDGYSLAFDFRVTRYGRATLMRMVSEFDRMVLAASGRFYFAKDSTLHPDTARAFLGTETLDTFRQLRTETDPEQILRTDLFDRLFGDR